MNYDAFDYIIIGSGFFGSTVAERLANESNKKVLIIEARDHIGGNAYSYIDPETGIDIHKYGSHIFHTSNQSVWDYIKKFTSFNNYRHKVQTLHKNKKYSMPINLQTINSFFDKNFTPDEVEEFLDSLKVKNTNPKNFEEQALSSIGEELYRAFIHGYTQKQWKIDPTLLPASIIKRLPVRNDSNDFYFKDKFEGIPTEGYGKIFDRMLSSPNIKVILNTDFFSIRDEIPSNAKVIYTGPIDKYFNYKYGQLNWRTLDFDIEIKETQSHQGIPVLNYSDLDTPYTRTHEFKFYTPEKKDVININKTVLYHEKSRKASKEDTPYYPVNTETDKNLFQQYFQLSKKEPNTYFGGRLGLYTYLDMDQVISSALNFYSKLK